MNGGYGGKIVTSQQMEKKLDDLMAEAIKNSYSDPIHVKDWQEVIDSLIRAKETLKKAVK